MCAVFCFVTLLYVQVCVLVWVNYHMGLDARKPVFGGLWTTKAQTSLHIRAVWSVPLSFVYSKVSYLDLLRTIFHFLPSLCSWADWFESCFVGNPEDRFSRDEAHIWPNNFLKYYTLFCKQCRARSAHGCWNQLIRINTFSIKESTHINGSVVKCLTRDRGAAGLSLTGITVLCPWARHI